MAWGDIDDDDNTILPPSRTLGPDKNGIKTCISYKLEDGVRYKVTQKSRIVKLTHRVSKAALERQATWERFGDASGDAEKNNALTYTSYEEIYMDDPESKKEDEQQKTLDSLINWAKGRKWRFKGGEGKEGEGGGPAGADDPNKYIAPHMRGQAGAAGASARMMEASSSFRDEGHTVRVTNISEDTREVDLQELFRPFGRTTRIYLAKDRVTMQSRGFAFVTFMHKEDAERAIDKLDGYGYDHLILKLEWSKPREPDGTGGGLSSGYTSGYGKALPQGLK